MPMYEYRCTKCGEEFEMLRSFTDEDEKIECPKCGAPGPTRTLSLFASSSESADNCAPSPSGGGGG